MASEEMDRDTSQYSDLTLPQPSSDSQMSRRYQLYARGYAVFRMRTNAYREIYFCLNDAINLNMEQILTTYVSDKKDHWIFILILNDAPMILTFYFTFL